MDRDGKILRHIDRTAPGLEIGPSYRPVAAKNNGFSVHIVDHMSREELIRKYQDQHVALENIEEVDFVWKGQSYAELTGNRKHYDWIIASHLIEHTPDLIGFLKDCDEVLKDDGVIALAIPDKRYCFDRFRPITGIARIIDSHFQKSAIHSPGTVAEYFLNVVLKSGMLAWHSGYPGDYRFAGSMEAARSQMDRVAVAAEFVDVHAWCFTPHSFRLLIQDLHGLGIIPFQEISFDPTEGCEFIVTLGRRGTGSGLSRFALLELIDSELADERSANQATGKQLLKCLWRRILNRCINGRVPSKADWAA